MAGRPSSYKDKIGQEIAYRLIDGQSLRSICSDSAMPDKSTVCRWLAKPDHPFRDHYAHAREIQAEMYADEIVDIADDGTNDYMLRQRGEDTVSELDREHVQRSKLRVDARKWVVSKLLPKKYGDRMTHANDPENPITPVLNVTVNGGS